MSLLQNWRDIAYNQEADKKQLQQFWTNYFLIEKNIYEQLLSNPDEVVKGTVKELAEKYKVDVMTMVGFLDGINDSLVIPNPIEEMEEDTVVTLAYDKELLYKNMVDAKADWLYNLPMWDEIFTEEQKKTLYMEQKKSGTVIKGKKIGRNDPCPCGSGKNRLLDTGLGTVYISLGAEGIYAADRQGSTAWVPCARCHVANATGGGDAVAAALAARMVLGDSLTDTAHWAVGAGALACEAETTINPAMCWDNIETILNRR